MKRFIILFLCLFLLAGCGNKDGKVVTIGQKTYAVRAQWNKQVIELDITLQNEDCIFDIKAPQELAGMRITCNKEDCKINYLGMEYELDSGIEVYSLASTVAAILKECDGTLVQGSKVEGSTNGINWTASLNEQGNLQSITSDEYNMKIEFE